MKKYFSSYWIRSAFYTFLQRFSLTIFGVINLILLTRSLSLAQMGTWAIFLTITGIFEATKTNLLKNAHIKYAAATDSEADKTAIASSSLLINMLISVIFIAAIFLFGTWAGKWLGLGNDFRSMLIWFIPGLISMIFFSHFESIQQSNLDFKGGFAGYFVRQVSFFLVIVIYKYFLPVSITLNELAMYQSGSVILGTIVLFIFSRKYLVYQFRVSSVWIKKLLNYGGYIFGSGLVANIFNNLDQLMTAKYMKSPGAVALYNVASRINVLVDIPSYAASDILFPKTSRAHAEEGTEKVKYMFERMVSILVAFTIPTALFIIIFPGLFIRVIAGPAYMAAIPILQLYMISGIIRPVQNQAANLLNSIGKTRLVFILNTIYLATVLVINYFALNHFGFYGAAIGTLISSLLNFILWYFVMRKQIGFDLKNVPGYIADTYRRIFHEAKKILGKKGNQDPPAA